MNKQDLFEKIYLNIITEQMNSDKEQKDAPIDDLTKQNIATIDEEDQATQDGQNKQESTAETQIQVTNEEPDEEVEQNDQNEFQEDGWGEDIEQQLSDILTDIDSLSYQIKNCRRGTYTRCNTKQELVQYIKNLAERLDQTAENL